MDWEERLGRSLRLIGWPVVGSKSPRWVRMSIPAEGHPAGPETFWIWIGKRQEQDGPLLPRHLSRRYSVQGLTVAPRPQRLLCVCRHLPACNVSAKGSLRKTEGELRTPLPKWGGAGEVVAPNENWYPGHLYFLVVSSKPGMVLWFSCLAIQPGPNAQLGSERVGRREEKQNLLMLNTEEFLPRSHNPSLVMRNSRKSKIKRLSTNNWPIVFRTVTLVEHPAAGSGQASGGTSGACFLEGKIPRLTSWAEVLDGEGKQKQASETSTPDGKTLWSPSIIRVLGGAYVASSHTPASWTQS